MQKEIEHSFFVADELRVADSENRLIGHAAVFNSVADLGFFREQIAPGAFAASINEDDVRALFNHDPNQVLGRNRSGTLKMKEDARGLAVDIQLPDTQNARDVMALIKRGDVSQMSFAFRTIEEDVDRSNPNGTLRTLKRVRLFDVSPVVFPAYSDTDIQVKMRSMEASRPRETETARRYISIASRRLEQLEAECRFASAL